MAFADIFSDRLPRQTGAWLHHKPRIATPSQSRAADLAADTDLSVHPAPILIGLASCAWFALLSWTCFAAFDRETGMAVAVITTIFVMYLGGMALGAYYSANSRAAGRGRTFRQFLRGRADIATGLISGREAMLQIATLPLGLAVGATAMALIWVFIR